jgi:oligopeptide/dipeptide ABC transporter ATP-binding protein
MSGEDPDDRDGHEGGAAGGEKLPTPPDEGERATPGLPETLPPPPGEDEASELWGVEGDEEEEAAPVELVQPPVEARLLVVEELGVRFETEEGVLTAVEGVSLAVPRERTVALVGESGSGKTVTAHAIMRLLRSPPAQVTGRVELEGDELLGLPERRMRAVRGKRIGFVFQDPLASLNPVCSVASQLSEAVRMHRSVGRRGARQEAIALLERVGFPEPSRRCDDYPHELSGGMRQRVMIAMAIAHQPALLIADEPTTMLDSLAAARINALLADLRRERKMSLLLISHDIALVADIADRVVVLYAGRVVEQGSAARVLARPAHPYTRGLLASVPPLRLERRRRQKTSARLPVIAGMPPDLRERAEGCRFAPRCPEVFELCWQKEPDLYAAGGDQRARCFLVNDAVGG